MITIIKIKSIDNNKGWRSTKWDLLRFLRIPEDCLIVYENGNTEREMIRKSELKVFEIIIAGEEYRINQDGTVTEKKKESLIQTTDERETKQ